MSTTTATANAKAVAELLEQLLGGAVTVRPVEPKKLQEGNPLAIYRDGAGGLAAIAMCDIHFGCYAGAALSMVPADVANEKARSGQVPDNLLEDLGEVMNICKQVLAGGSSATRLAGIERARRGMDKELTAVLARPGRRCDFEVAVEQYGTGRLSVFYP